MSNQETADFLCELRASNSTVPTLPEGLQPPSLDDAYATQVLVVKQLELSSGSPAAGYKIALSSASAQALTGATHPVFGRLIGRNVHPDGTNLESQGLGTCIVEVEFGFRMKADVPAVESPYDAQSIKAYVDCVYPSIEIVDHHYVGLAGHSVEAIVADNAIHGSWVHGEPCAAWADENLAEQATSLSVNGEVVLTGAGNRTLDDPFAALAWVANALPQYGLALRAGDFVTSGLTTDGIYEATAGDHLHADFGRIGTVDLTIS